LYRPQISMSLCIKSWLVWLEPRWYTGAWLPSRRAARAAIMPPDTMSTGITSSEVRVLAGICMCPFMNMNMTGAMVLMPSFHPGEGKAMDDSITVGAHDGEGQPRGRQHLLAEALGVRVGVGPPPVLRALGAGLCRSSSVDAPVAHLAHLGGKHLPRRGLACRRSRLRRASSSNFALPVRVVGVPLDSTARGRGPRRISRAGSHCGVAELVRAGGRAARAGRPRGYCPLR
jgi:hypothetical protein